jgi:hypothetical protein
MDASLRRQPRPAADPASADEVIVRVRGALFLSDNTEPQPSLTVLRRGAVSRKHRDPWAEDSLLVVEVAETSLASPAVVARSAS